MLGSYATIPLEKQYLIVFLGRVPRPDTNLFNYHCAAWDSFHELPILRAFLTQTILNCLLIRDLQLWLLPRPEF